MPGLLNFAHLVSFDVYCAGDLMNSGAPADPIFWTIHPTVSAQLRPDNLFGVITNAVFGLHQVDRLWQWRRINGMTNTSWPPSSQNYVHGGDCWGHSEDDVTIFKNLFDTDGHFYTNGEPFVHGKAQILLTARTYICVRRTVCTYESFE